MFERLPWALLAIGIALGGIIVLWIFKSLLKCCCLPRKYRDKYVLFEETDNDGKKKPIWVKTTGKPWNSVKHLFLEVAFFIATAIVLWIASAVAGFNFWTSSIVGVGLGLVGTYVFGTPLRTLGSSIFVYSKDLVEEGFYIQIENVEGRVVELHPLGAELEAIDRTTGAAMMVHVPMDKFLTEIWVRKYREEKLLPATSIHPDEVIDRFTGERKPKGMRKVSPGNMRTKEEGDLMERGLLTPFFVGQKSKNK